MTLREGEEFQALQGTPRYKASSGPPKQHSPPQEGWHSLLSHTGPCCSFCAVGSQNHFLYWEWPHGIHSPEHSNWENVQENLGRWKEKGFE